MAPLVKEFPDKNIQKIIQNRPFERALLDLLVQVCRHEPSLRVVGVLEPCHVGYYTNAGRFSQFVCAASCGVLHIFDSLVKRLTCVRSLRWAGAVSISRIRRPGTAHAKAIPPARPQAQRKLGRLPALARVGSCQRRRP